MKSAIIAVLLCLGAVIQVRAQSSVTGKVTDDNGEPLIGVTITLKSDNTVGVATDFDGNYTFELPANQELSLVISYVSFHTIEQAIRLSENETKRLDVIMQAESLEMDAIEIVAKANRGNEHYMENLKKKSASTIDYMPASLMKKLGDSNVSSAIARVSGVSTNGSFITVRGIGDRYVRTAINGAIIPTLDPFTNNIKLDIFPSSLVDNIIITKSNSPELNGDWSAAYISIATKDFPEELDVRASLSVEYNPQVTFKSILAGEQSSTDWLGYDNDLREINHDLYKQVDESPALYDQFVALGLGDYYRSLGITESWQANSAVHPYTRLGLVKLGLLGSAYLYDGQEASRAMDKYREGTYYVDAFRNINEEAVRGNAQFSNTWATKQKNVGPNISQSISIGNQWNVFGKPLGFIAGFRYKSSNRFDPSAAINRTQFSELTEDGRPVVEEAIDFEAASYSRSWTGLVNTNVKWSSNSQYSLLFMINQKGSDNIRSGVDTLVPDYNYAYSQSQFYEERRQLVYQLKTEQYIPRLKLKLTGQVSYADGSSSAPDFKELNYYSQDGVSFLFDKTLSNIRRNFRYLDEDVLDVQLHGELPLATVAGKVSKLKFGASYVDLQRDYAQYDYLIPPRLNLVGDGVDTDIASYFNLRRFQFKEDGNDIEVPLFYVRSDDPANFTTGHSRITSGYVMGDHSLTERIRLSGGVRVEQAKLYADAQAFDAAGLAADDLRRRSSITSFVLAPASIEKVNVLPSLNVIYRLSDGEGALSNIRFGYGRAVARPSVREITETLARDFELNAEVFGNAELKFVDVNNFDLRYEKYFASGDNLSISAFYKQFTNHIELVSSNLGFTWLNADESRVLGVELEGKKKLGEQWEFRSNISLVNSFTRIQEYRLEITDGVKTLVPTGMRERTMFGQAPYVINAILNYSFSDAGLNASLSYNVQGPKLVLTSIDQAPDVYEMSRHLLNVKATKRLSSHFSASFTIKNVLDAPIRRSYDFDRGYLLDFDRFDYGTTYSLGISYKL